MSQRLRFLKHLSLLLVLVFGGLSLSVSAQESSPTVELSNDDTVRLNKLVDALDKKQLAREALQKTFVAAGGLPSAEDQRELDDINSDIQSLRETFELLTVGDMDDALFKAVESA
ncbi:hypothetical protein N9850_10450, partial [Granulosicoccus sp.]